ncbi:MAG TPA: Zn-dependent hydrolase, partial [Anseongella sp.]|nr:Zn-dependent hydrolase [Anseongella sp.]
MKKRFTIMAGTLLTAALSCEKPDDGPDNEQDMQKKLDQYVSMELSADISGLSENERKMLPLLIDAAKVMDSLFWYEAYGNGDSLLASLEDEAVKQYVRINYGPWDRLDNNAPFLEGVGSKPEGANFYPADMTREEFEQASLPGKDSLYTFLRRDSAGRLYTVPYHEMFPGQVKRASRLLREAAGLAEDEGLKNYLELRAEALLTDQYRPSDLAWLDMKNNTIELVIGPIE